MDYFLQGKKRAFAAKVVVIKAGSMVLTVDNSRLDMVFISALARVINRWRSKGRKVLLVSSGAVAAGLCEMQYQFKPNTIPQKQALAAIGQGRLMATYGEIFRHHDIRLAQILLTQEDMDHRRRYLNSRLALETLLKQGVLPVINENDTTAIDELKFGDNDILCARVAAKMQADLLLILTNVDGLYSKDPRRHADAKVIPVVEAITDETRSLAGKAKSFFGLGGMAAKIRAAELATRAGIHTVIANGKRHEVLEGLLEDKLSGTVFLPSAQRRLSSRLAWIAAGRSSRNHKLIVDEGAARMIREKNKSLLAAGIREAEGNFEFGDVVEILDEGRRLIARGLSNYSRGDVEKIKGLKSGDIAKVLGSKPYDEVVHRDNLVLL